MVDLTDKDVREFQSLFRRETGRAITPDEARRYATSLIELVTLVLRIERQA